MKLHATLETSRGKVVSVSDNEEIIATVYDGNMKAYSITINWCDIGDIIDNDGNELPESEKTKGAIITTREWRNEPEEKRKGKTQLKLCEAQVNEDFCPHYATHKDGYCNRHHEMFK